ncbi:hypothetical protein VTN77DRAFT_2200 [Rasamsonia byssochlamydoides]|uniref:uncharacterized protein n=1 Tax=Rasamsonia byssochlamydoides TaxID=89139 RepID=UPI003743B748
MSSSQIFQNLLSLPARSRQQVGTWRNRFWSADKSKKEGHLLRTSFSIHRPVWIAAGGATYTTLGAVYLTLRFLRHVR